MKGLPEISVISHRQPAVLLKPVIDIFNNKIQSHLRNNNGHSGTVYDCEDECKLLKMATRRKKYRIMIRVYQNG